MPISLLLKSANAQEPARMDFLDSLFRSEQGLYDSLSSLRQSASVRILYSRVDRAANGMPLISLFRWDSDSLRYFSSEPVHLPLALLALHKMEGYRQMGIERTSTMITEAATDDQMPAYNDPRWPGGRPSLERYVSNMLLLHEPSSFDRIYEFLGQDYLLNEFFSKGYAIRYLGRQEQEPDEASRHTNPVVFFDENTKPLFRQEAASNPKEYPKFSGEDSLYDKNLLDPESLHRLFTGLIYPERVSSSERFEISAENRKFLLTCISRLPRETVFPYHDSASLNENAFFLALLPGKPGLRVFHSGGYKDMQVVETVFAVDTLRGVEFILTAAVWFDDESSRGKAFDFLSSLGEVIYRFEIKRPRAFKPDLSPFILRYDR